MRIAPKSKHEWLPVVVARLHRDHPSATQEQLAQTLRELSGEFKRVGQPQVSRVIEDLEKSQVLKSRVEVDLQKLSAEDRKRWDALDARYFKWKPLRDKLQSRSPYHSSFRLEVVTADELDPFGVQAAKLLSHMLRESQVIGVAWGRTLAAVIQNMHREDWRNCHAETIVPVCADPLHVHNLENDQRFSSSFLAAELERVIRDQPDPYARFLRGVPAYIPSRFSREIMAIRSFIETIPGYRAVFVSRDGKAAPFIEQADTILTAAGVIADQDEETGTFLRERLAQEPKIASTKLRQWIAGDIGGILLPREDLRDPTAKKLIKSMNRGWIGLTQGHLRRCAAGVERKYPGVVLIARGAVKKTVVGAAIREGLASTVVISTDLARALEED